VIVQGSEKRFRVRRMNGHRNPQSSAFRRDGSSRGCNRNQLACPVAYSQPRSFNTFSPRAPRFSVIQLRHHLRSEIRVVDLAPVILGKTINRSDKASPSCPARLVIYRPYAGRIDLLHISAIHSHQFRGRNFFSVNTSGVVDMTCMSTTGALRGSIVGFGVHHRLRVEILQQQCHVLAGSWLYLISLYMLPGVWLAVPVQDW
jgi:hypothetical protein